MKTINLSKLQSYQPCFIETCSKELAKEYPWVLCKDKTNNTYHATKDYDKNKFMSYDFIARFKDRNNALDFGKSILEETTWNVYLDLEKNKYVVILQSDLDKINPRYKFIKEFTSINEAKEFKTQNNFYNAILNTEEHEITTTNLKEVMRWLINDFKVVGRPINSNDDWIEINPNKAIVSCDWEYCLARDVESRLEVIVFMDSSKKVEEIMHKISSLEGVASVSRL